MRFRRGARLLRPWPVITVWAQQAGAPTVVQYRSIWAQHAGAAAIGNIAAFGRSKQAPLRRCMLFNRPQNMLTHNFRFVFRARS